MIRVLAILEKTIVIISSDTTVSVFGQIHKETPLRGYYDELFNYSFARRTQVRFQDSIKYTNSNTFPFNSLIGITINPKGELYTHVHAYNNLGEGFGSSEQVADFQGNINNLTNSWFGGSTYVVNALSLVWEQSHSLDPESLFKVLEPSSSSSEIINVSTINKDSLLASIDMFNKGMPLSEIIKLWDIQTYIRPKVVKFYKSEEVQEFNTQNLSYLASYHTVTDQPAGN